MLFRSEEKKNEFDARISLDLLEERREQASLVAEARRHQIARYHNSRVRLQDFSIRDLVLRKAEVGKGIAGTGKLGPTWEGPYKIAAKTNKGAYKLRSLDGKDIPRYWNIESLRKFYQ